MTSPLLDMKNLSCERDGRLLFAGLSKSINRGDIVQIRGPNGAGKTSLLRILLGIASDFGGELRWQGVKLQEALLDFRNHLLYIGHTPAIKRTLTPRENLQWYSDQERGHLQISIADALAEVGLMGYEDVPCFQLSAGQLRRVALARLFLTPAPVWILDEPFTAIDVDGVAALQERFREHCLGGGVVVLTTHQELNLDNVQFLDLLDFIPTGDEYADLHDYSHGYSHDNQGEP